MVHNKSAARRDSLIKSKQQLKYNKISFRRPFLSDSGSNLKIVLDRNAQRIYKYGVAKFQKL